ncbi:MAG: hypothetical protein ACO3A4_11110 [Silvanigrellaceae bacterium]
MMFNCGVLRALSLAFVGALGCISCVSKPLLEEQPAPFGKDACLESPIVGSWKASMPADDTWTFSPDCSAVSAACRSRFLYPPNLSKAGLVNIKVTESDGPEGCLDKGNHRCTFSILSNSATVNCGKQTFQLTRI